MPVNTDSTANFLAILPEILLALLACFVILMDVFSARSRHRDIAIVASAGLFLIALATVFLPLPAADRQLVLGGMLRQDVMTQLFTVITLVGAGIACLISIDAPG